MGFLSVGVYFTVREHWEVYLAVVLRYAGRLQGQRVPLFPPFNPQSSAYRMGVTGVVSKESLMKSERQHAGIWFVQVASFRPHRDAFPEAPTFEVLGSNNTPATPLAWNGGTVVAPAGLDPYSGSASLNLFGT